MQMLLNVGNNATPLHVGSIAMLHCEAAQCIRGSLLHSLDSVIFIPSLHPLSFSENVCDT